MSRRRYQTPIVEKLLKQAAVLTPEELMALHSGIEGLLSEVYQRPQVDEYGKPHSQKGYIESKLIKGCGPYRYLRYWDGKTHKSVYLGKGSEEKG